MDDDERWMRRALAVADDAAARGEVPVGCVIASGEGRILGKAHNQREVLQDPTAHAEMIAISQAAGALESWRLVGATCYVTLEPCPMCAGALVLARVERLVYGALDPKAGACESLYEIPRDARLNHRIEVTGGVLAAECGQRLSDFFAALRDGRSSGEDPPSGGNGSRPPGVR